MVLQRTIDNLKERPRHEREAVAYWIAVAVVIILVLAWGVFFFRSLGSTNLHPVNDAYSQTLQQVQAANSQAQAAAADDVGWVSSAPQAPSASQEPSAASQIQIIQEDSVPQSDDPTQ